jgi:hypothetical protein
MTTCTRCGRALSDPISISIGMGPVCRANDATERQIPMSKDKHDLPFDADLGDIVFGPGWDGSPHFNIPLRHIHHSPAGWSWGYGGSGPADFALNILAHFVDGTKLEFEDPVRLWDGTNVPVVVWNLHQLFKRDFLENLPQDGGETIVGSVIRTWLRERGVPAEAIR